MERQIYSEQELLENIHRIEWGFDSIKYKEIEYDIMLEKNTEPRVVKFMFDNISEHCMIDESEEENVYEWKVIYNNILIVVDFENVKLFLKYFENEINKTDIDYILDLFAFLDPTNYDI